MAWHIDEQVIRGEIDNRTRGCVTGRLWLVGHAAPMELVLTGNCWRDLAGRRLEFTNPTPKPGDTESLAMRQEGSVGDISVSRKVKVPEVSTGELMELYKQRKPFPWHWGNSLYFEWFSTRNGRIVIESAGYELKIVGEPAWEMTTEEEIEQRKANGAAITGFMDRLVKAADGQDRQADDDTPEEWNETPQTEAEAEAEQARSDLLMDRIEARLQREGENADYEKILEEEMERMRRERGDEEPTPGQLERNAEWIEDAERAVEAARTNPDPELEEEAEWEHPLAQRVMALSLGLIHRAKAQGWYREEASDEHPVAALLSAAMIAGPKYAGTLNGEYWPPEVDFCAHTIVRLKRARGFVEDALRAAGSCEEDKLVPPEHLAPIRAELADFLGETDVLIAELRAKLERGTD